MKIELEVIEVIEFDLKIELEVIEVIEFDLKIELEVIEVIEFDLKIENITNHFSLGTMDGAALSVLCLCR
ncbi:MAG: hypothetical protein IIY87_03270 [Bacteroidales bacterium]|nr:hypothetical protein [Bacteroidales bacterium]